MLVSDVAQLNRLAAGQRVRLDADGILVTGRIADSAPVRSTSATVGRELSIDALAGGVRATGSDPARPVWRVAVALDAGQQIAGTASARAVVDLPGMPVYRLLTGLVS